MNKSTVLRGFGLSRVAFGLWLALAPQKPGEMWFGGAEHPASTSALLRSVGGRDVGLGLGLASDPRPGSPWVKVGIIADAVDAVAVVLNRDRLPTKNFMTGLLGALLYTVVAAVVVASGDSDR